MLRDLFMAICKMGFFLVVLLLLAVFLDILRNRFLLWLAERRYYSMWGKDERR
jgi:hypothetical protein